MAWVLTLAGIYNLVWGSLVILFPAWMFSLGGLQKPDQPLNYPEVWQCVGMVVGVYGVGYLIAATDPLRHWPIVLVGFLGKLFGPIGVANAAWNGALPWSSVWTNLFNDLIWLVPFGLILRAAAHASHEQANAAPAEPLRQSLEQATTSTGTNLLALSLAGPTLVVFLRHFG
jgi:hypothetical protein